MRDPSFIWVCSVIRGYIGFFGKPRLIYTDYVRNATTDGVLYLGWPRGMSVGRVSGKGHAGAREKSNKGLSLGVLYGLYSSFP